MAAALGVVMLELLVDLVDLAAAEKAVVVQVQVGLELRDKVTPVVQVMEMLAALAVALGLRGLRQ